MIKRDFPLSLVLVGNGYQYNLPLYTDKWVVSENKDIAYLEDAEKHLSENCAGNCSYDLYTNYQPEVISTLFGQFFEIHGHPIQHMKQFRRSTRLASTEIDEGKVYTDDPSIQGFSGGPFVAPQVVVSGVITQELPRHGVVGVVSATHSDDTGGKMGIIVLVDWQ